MWEKGYVPEVDEEAEAEEKELLAQVRQEQAKLLLDRKSALEGKGSGDNVMMRMSVFARQRYVLERIDTAVPALIGRVDSNLSLTLLL